MNANAERKSLQRVIDECRTLAAGGRRFIPGLKGAPAAGRTALVTLIADALGPQLVVSISMDITWPTRCCSREDSASAKALHRRYLCGRRRTHKCE
jgi:hypothetical protein